MEKITARCESCDHQLVVANVKLKLKRLNIENKTIRKYNVDRLAEAGTRINFLLGLRNRFQALQDMEEEEENTGTVDAPWLKLETVYKEASKKHLGYKERKKKKEWIQEDTRDAMEERRNAEKKAIDAKSARLKERLERESTLRNIKGSGEWQNETKESI